MSRRDGPTIRGDVARAVRLARGHTAKHVSEQTGIDASTLSLIEKGDRPGRPRLVTLAHFLDVAPAVLSGQHPAVAVLRDIAGLTSTEFARSIGVTRARLARIEAGSEHPDDETAEKIAVQLGVPASVVRPQTEAGEAA
jgi:transcriptional regulator with XRE-family HTH domain